MRADEAEGSVGRSVVARRGERAGADERGPRRGVGPREGGEVDVELLVVGRDGGGGGGEVDEHVAEPHGAHREGDRELHGLVRTSDERGEGHRGADVGGVEHRRVGQRAQHPGARGRAAAVVARREVEEAHGAPRSRRSDSSSTNAVGGCQAKTPQGRPSTTGTSAPLMPRRNR